MKRTVFLCVLAVLALNLTGLTIKLGSTAPSGSPWDKCLQEIALQWKKESKGAITVKIYPGSISGDEALMLRKINLRQLQAAAISHVGLNNIHKGILSLSVPLLLENEDEVRYAIEKMGPVFNKELEKKNYVVLMWTFVGWVHFFSKKPVIEPDDLRKMKFWVWEDSADEVQVWKKAKFNPVPLALPNVMTSLQSGMIEAVTCNRLTAALYQWFGIANHMCEMEWAPIFGAFVISKNVWEQIPKDLRPKFIDICTNASKQLDGDIKAVEDEALSVMKKNGLITHTVPADVYAQWKKVVSANFDHLIDTAMDRPTYNLLKSHIDEFRKKKK